MNRRSPRLHRWLSALVPALVLVVSCGGSGQAPSAAPDELPGTLEEICALGAEEGQLVHWHNHSEGIVKVFDAFNKAYPDIEIEALEMTPDDAAQRVLTEHSSGRGLSADIVAGSADVFQAVIDEDLVDRAINWTDYGVPKDVIHPANILRIHRIAMGLGYNTNALSAEDLPDTWEGLIDERWRGEVIVDPRGRPFDKMSLVWGEQQTLDYVRRLKQIVAPLVIEGGTAGLVAVAGGEADITTGGRSAETLEQQALGAPLEIKYLDIVPTHDNYNIVLADAEHLNAARCFAAWFSTDGLPIYLEAEFKTNDTVPPAAPEGAKIVTTDSAEEEEKIAEIGRKIGRIWTQ